MKQYFLIIAVFLIILTTTVFANSSNNKCNTPASPEVDWSKCVIKDKDLHGADLRNAILIGTEFHNIDLSNANLSGAKLENANLIGANLILANLEGADLRYANLSKARMAFANLKGADLFIANLSGAELRNANLSSADLYKANLESTVLINANLTGADLLNASFAGTQMSGAIIDGFKCYPSSPSGKCIFTKPIWLKTTGGFMMRHGKVGQNCSTGYNRRSCSIIYDQAFSAGLVRQIGIRNQENEVIMMGWDGGEIDSVGSIKFSDDPGSLYFDYFRKLKTISFDYYSNRDYRLHLQTMDGNWHAMACDSGMPSYFGCHANAKLDW